MPDELTMESRRTRSKPPRLGEVLQTQTVVLRISGRVQGVGFRDALSEQAARLGLTGWVRNRANGEVEALAQGNPEALEALEAWARRGPPSARVARVARSAPTAEHARRYARFERWPSA